MALTDPTSRISDISASAPRKGRLRLLGVGKDMADSHVRITSADHYRLEGGSDETHARMQEAAERLMQKIGELGYSPDSMTRAEYEHLMSTLEFSQE